MVHNVILRRVLEQNLQYVISGFRREVDENCALLMYVCPCIIYEIDERYPLDAKIVIYYYQ